MVMTRVDFWKRHAALETPEGRYALHREYYGQYVEAANIRIPTYLLDKCRVALAAGDHYFNSPYTSLRDWDELSLSTQMDVRVTKLRKENKDGWSLSFNICVLKEAALRQLEAGQ
ncbi:hypothetical protein ACQZ40_25260 [Agrobacterium sp. 16-172Ci]